MGIVQHIEYTVSGRFGDRDICIYSVYQLPEMLLLVSKMSDNKSCTSDFCERVLQCDVELSGTTKLLPIQCYLVDSLMRPGSLMQLCHPKFISQTMLLVQSEEQIATPENAICVFGNDFIGRRPKTIAKPIPPTAQVSDSRSTLFSDSPTTLITIEISADSPAQSRVGEYNIVNIKSFDKRIICIESMNRDGITIKIPTSHAAEITDNLRKHPCVLMVNGQRTAVGEKMYEASWHQIKFDV